MRIVFMGTPGFAATVLENLQSQHDVLAVFTAPDAVRGRGAKLIPSPVSQIASKYAIPIHTPSTLRDADTISEIIKYEPDVICVAAYGKILPPEVLDLPRYGCLNVHASALPRWRGAAPVERAILAKDAKAGVCVMKMDEGLDTGDFSCMRNTAIDSKNATELTTELADLGSQALLTVLAQIQDGTVEWIEQDDLYALYADKIVKREFFLAPRDHASHALLKVQASSPAHPSRVLVASRPVTMLSLGSVDVSELPESVGLLNSGHIILAAKRLFMAFDDGVVEIIEVKPDGKRAMLGKDFAAGIQNVKSGLITWDFLHE